MAEHEKLEAFEYKGKTYHFRRGQKIAETLAPFDVHSTRTYEACEKETGKHGWLIFSPVLAFIAGLTLMVVTDNYLDFSFVLWATAIMYLIAMFTVIGSDDGASREIRRLKEYAMEKERKQAYDAWLSTKTATKEQDGKLRDWIESNKAKSE